MLIPTPIATLLTALACKAVCNLVFEDKDTHSAVTRAMEGHDTFSREIAKEIIRRELEEGEQDED